MPTANSAVGGQPIIRTSAIARRLRQTVFAASLGAAVLLPVGLFGAPGVAAHVPSDGTDCSRWTSTTTPPDYIRVLRHRSNRVVRVPFRRYVVTVMGKEWPSYLPQALVEAGAVAVKQYAWYHVLHGPRHTRDGRCYDVRDGTGDQLYKPHRARVNGDHYTAADATWNVTLMRHGKLMMTGYRRGHNGRCGRDANGWKLYARTGARCAHHGKDYLEILQIYYGPHVTILR